jgi:hypothetical protein
MKLYGYHHHHNDNPWDAAPAWAIELMALMEINHMATKAQLDKFMADVQALIAAGVAEITAAVAAAQNASNDPAIDALDTQVTQATQALTDAAAALQPPPPAPTP